MRAREGLRERHSPCDSLRHLMWASLCASVLLTELEIHDSKPALNWLSSALRPDKSMRAVTIIAGSV